MKVTRKKIAGFSLVEVNIAIFVVATGMLTLFSLFPIGLRQAASSSANTQEAMFVDFVFSTLRSEAASLSSSEWTSNKKPTRINFLYDIIEDQLGGSSALGGRRVEFPGGSDEYMIYKLSLANEGNLVTAKLKCQAGESVAAGYSIKPYESEEYKKAKKK